MLPDAFKENPNIIRAASKGQVTLKHWVLLFNSISCLFGVLRIVFGFDLANFVLRGLNSRLIAMIDERLKD